MSGTIFRSTTALDRAAATRSLRARRGDASRVTSAPTATRSARCSRCTTCCAPRASSSVASFSEPFVVAPHYRELPGLELLTPPDRFPREPEVMVTFDSGSLARLGDLEPHGQGRRRAHRHRPPRVEPALRHDQRDRSRRGRERRARAAADRRARPPAQRATPRSASTPRSSATPAASSTSRRRPAVFELAARARRVRPADRRELSRTLFEEHRFAYLQLLADVLSARGARAREAVRVDEGHARPTSRATTSRSTRSRA